MNNNCSDLCKDFFIGVLVTFMGVIVVKGISVPDFQRALGEPCGYYYSVLGMTGTTILSAMMMNGILMNGEYRYSLNAFFVMFLVILAMIFLFFDDNISSFRFLTRDCR